MLLNSASYVMHSLVEFTWKTDRKGELCERLSECFCNFGEDQGDTTDIDETTILLGSNRALFFLKDLCI